MISKKHLALTTFLAVYRYFSSAPLSLIQRHLEEIYYFGTVVPPKIIPWYSSQTNKVQFEIVNIYGSVRFDIVVNGTINYLNWFLENLKRNNSGDPDNRRRDFRDNTLNLNITNNSRTYEMRKRSFLVTI